MCYFTTPCAKPTRLTVPKFNKKQYKYVNEIIKIENTNFRGTYCKEITLIELISFNFIRLIDIFCLCPKNWFSYQSPMEMYKFEDKTIEPISYFKIAC